MGVKENIENRENSKLKGPEIAIVKIELPYDPAVAYWAYTLRKPELKETRVPQCSSQHCL